MFATGLEMHQIVEVPNANFLALLFKSGRLLLMNCDYSVVTMAIIGKPVSFSVLLQTLCNLQYRVRGHISGVMIRGSSLCTLCALNM